MLLRSLDRPCELARGASDLYWLGYLLTGDSEQAAQAFSSALEFEDAANPVFRGFMVSWARKLVVASALATMTAKLRASALRVERSELSDSPQHAGLPPPGWISSRSLGGPELERALLAIDVFPRCALLLTIFEKLSIHDAALLLNSGEPLLRKAQARALIDLTHNLAEGESRGHYSPSVSAGAPGDS
jgi:hypothetical protein